MTRVALILAVLASLMVPTSAAAKRHMPPARHAQRHPPIATVSAVTAPQGPEERAEEPGRHYWPEWGNVAPTEGPGGIADCTFAAAADWEMMMLGTTPDASQLIREFHEAGGHDETGINMGSFVEWWEKHGVDGVRVRLVKRYNSWLDALVQRDKAVIASISNHLVVVAGFNATGPEVITYGETRTETWAEWREYRVALYVPQVLSMRDHSTR
jgi:hypothetical protein